MDVLHTYIPVLSIVGKRFSRIIERLSGGIQPALRLGGKSNFSPQRAQRNTDPLKNENIVTKQLGGTQAAKEHSPMSLYVRSARQLTIGVSKSSQQRFRGDRYTTKAGSANFERIVLENTLPSFAYT
jgi:hypothetical protein